MFNMICPNCQAEYRKGFTTCSDCNVPLVEELPELPKEAPDEASEIRDSAQSMIFVAADAVEAETVKGLLEASGIAVNLANESSPFPGVPGLASGLKLVVNSAQESLARQVLDEYRVSAIGPSDAQEDTSAFEPECGLPEEVEGDTESSELGELCPNCRTQCSSADTSCPECGQELSDARSSDTAATSNNEAARVGTFRSREADFRDI